jgi:hypothetical protein
MSTGDIIMSLPQVIYNCCRISLSWIRPKLWKLMQRPRDMNKASSN